MPIPLRRYASATLCALSFCAFAAAAKASPLPTSLTFTGDTQGESPLWNRPTINTSPGTSLALAGGGQGWVAEEFTVATSGQYT